MLLIPIMAYAGAILLVEANIEQGWIPLPVELLRPVSLPYLGQVPHLGANLAATVLLSFIGFALLSFLYSILFRVVNPDPLGPLDAKPVRSRPPARPRATRGRRG
jgi:hypothetical protein